MKKLFYTIMGLLLSLISLNSTFAESGTGRVNSGQSSGIFGNGITGQQLRYGEVHTDNIPRMITGVINFLLGLSGTIAVIFIIVGAYKILFSSFEGNKTAGKNTIIMAVTGFAIASLAWVIINFIIQNFQRGGMGV